MVQYLLISRRGEIRIVSGLMPYGPKTVTKNKKTRRINICEFSSTAMALIPLKGAQGGLKRVPLVDQHQSVMLS